MLGLFRRKGKKREADPLAAFDALLEDLERQGAQVRKSAATLIAMKGELARAIERDERKLADIAARLAEAKVQDDARAVRTLERDKVHAEAQLTASKEAHARGSADAGLLLELAEDLSRKVVDLKAERTSAQARLQAGQLVSEALRHRSAEIQKVLAVDAARDEVERAHALAEIYREEKEG